MDEEDAMADLVGARSAFWDDHDADMANPEYRRHFILESRRIAVIDAVVNALDELRVQQGVSKAELARTIERQPASVRRLLTSQQVNPSLGMVTDMAAALGYEVVLQPMSKSDKAAVTDPLRELAAIG
jgi:ribosome-binding protein aMBF1 (putative translation factor)